MSVRRPDVAAWLRRAEHDLVAIERVTVTEPIPWDVVCFHAQQAAEKLFKALLIKQGIDPPRTHDLTALLELVRDASADLHRLEPECRLLTPLITIGRYPSPFGEPTAVQGRPAIAAVERVATVLRPLIDAT
jgi:HEPN domain-containing protein